MSQICLDNILDCMHRFINSMTQLELGVKAAECCLQTVKFFDFVQHLYSFFAGSTHLWTILTSSVGKHFVAKHLSDTRWSAHFDAVHALYGGFEKIKPALDSLSADNE